MDIDDTTGFFVNDPAWAIDFAPNGTRIGESDILRKKRYADLLETIAAEGPDAFYHCAIANATIKTLQAANGTMTLEDLANYIVEIREPLSITYREYTITTCGAPSGGPVALQFMKTVEGYSDFGEAMVINISTHRLDEAIRYGYGSVESLHSLLRKFDRQ
jgi:gamma-glutamyltranspeptidase/glutathione hydrolase